MGLMDDIREQQNRAAPPKCGVALALLALDDADAADLTAALADLSITGTVISRALDANGHRVSDQSVNRHRRGICGCDR
jgi:hypothetical protein